MNLREYWITRSELAIERVSANIDRQRRVVAQHREAGRNDAADVAEEFLDILLDRLEAHRDRLRIHRDALRLGPVRAGGDAEIPDQ